MVLSKLSIKRPVFATVLSLLLVVLGVILAASLGISVHTLDALAESDTSADAVRARETLRDLARLTGGRYFRAGDGAAGHIECGANAAARRQRASRS